jgi:hypothetical protein
MTDSAHSMNLRDARLGVSITAQGDEAMKNVTTAASREQKRRLKEATAILGEESMHCILDAFLQNSEQPLLGLPVKWRKRAIARFRQIIRKREVGHARIS